MIRLACVAFLGACCGLVWLACSASAQNIEEETGILSGHIVERSRAVTEIRKQRVDTVAHLLSVLEYLKSKENVDDSFTGPRSHAIQLVGEYRARQAVPILASGLTFIPSGFELDEIIPSEAYNLCAVALWQIGFPAIGTLTNILFNSEEEEEWKLAAWVLAQIEGVDEAVHRLTRLAEDAPHVADRLAKAIAHIRGPHSELRDPTDGKGRPGKWK